MTLQAELDAVAQKLEAWQRAKKPAHLLESHEDRARFKALFCDDLVIGDAWTIRSVWWNGTPEFPGDIVPLLTWHPLVHASMPAKVLWDSIHAALDGFDVTEAWYWQDERTRWTYLTLRAPDAASPSRGPYPTNYSYRVARDNDGTWGSTLESAS